MALAQDYLLDDDLDLNIVNGDFQQGASWVKEPLKYWNGASWATKPLKVWDGAIWQLIDITG